MSSKAFFVGNLGFMIERNVSKDQFLVRENRLAFSVDDLSEEAAGLKSEWFEACGNHTEGWKASE